MLILVAAQKFNEARTLYGEMLQHLSGLYGAQSERVLRVKGSLAGLLRRMGEHEAARQTYKEVAAGHCALLGASHAETLLSTGSLASLLISTGASEVERAEGSAMLAQVARAYEQL